MCIPFLREKNSQRPLPRLWNELSSCRERCPPLGTGAASAGPSPSAAVKHQLEPSSGGGVTEFQGTLSSAPRNMGGAGG